ncbi:Phage protein [plant metagenome]|uniref:Phage protein n=1 Tax=plant metagenome TaxID=1297885 RepID=A0A484TD85_9ZZZZ
MWVQIAILVVSLIVSYATRPRPTTPKASAFGADDFPQAEEGTAQCVIFGDVWVEDWMVLGVGNFRTQAIKSKGGKK